MASHYKPTISDVLVVKSFLAKMTRTPLPPELIDQIIDFACYWPHITGNTTTSATARGSFSRTSEDIFLLRSPPICAAGTLFKDGKLPPDAKIPKVEPQLVHPVRMIVWTLRSHDQGFSGEPAETKGTYGHSFTWFDVGIERYVPAREWSRDDEEVIRDSGKAKYTSEDLIDVWPGTSNSLPPPPDTSNPIFTLHNEDESSTSPQEPTHRMPRVLPTRTPAWSFGRRPAAAPSPPATPPAPSPPTGDSFRDASTSSSTITPPHYANFTSSFAPPVPSESDWSSQHRLQSNVQAVYQSKTHVITWRYDDNIAPESVEGDELESNGRGRATGNGEFVRELKMGDCVTLWAHARFPAWYNVVERAEVEVYFAV